MSFWRMYYLLVWATKNREPTITPELEIRLFPYIVKKAAAMGVYVYAIDGWLDHIHLAVAVPPKRSIAEVVKTMKRTSSHYVNQNYLIADHFLWQEGYGVFTLGEKQRAAAVAYVRNQKILHRDNSANAWLERSQIVNDGPQGPGVAKVDNPGRLSEKPVDSSLAADLPF